MDLTIKELPEGTELIGLFPATAEDYSVMNGFDGKYIAKGARNNSALDAIVKPALGYAFIPNGFEGNDPRAMINGRPKFAVAKLLGTFSNDGTQFTPQPKTVTVTTKFLVENELHEAQMETGIKEIAAVVGFQGMERS